MDNKQQFLNGVFFMFEGTLSRGKKIDGLGQLVNHRGEHIAQIREITDTGVNWYAYTFNVRSEGIIPFDKMVFPEPGSLGSVYNDIPEVSKEREQSSWNWNF